VYNEDVHLECEVEGGVPFHPSTDHVESRITLRALPSRFGVDYKSFIDLHTSSYTSPEDVPWLYVSLPSNDENLYESDDDETNTQPSTNTPDPELTTPDQPPINTPDPELTTPDQPRINTPGLEPTTLDQSTPSYAIDRADDIFEMSPECEIDIVSDEPIIELTMRW